MAYSNDTRPTASYSNDTRPTASYSNDTRPAAVNTFLLKEDSYYLLLETGDKIVLDRAFYYTNDAEPT